MHGTSLSAQNERSRANWYREIRCENESKRSLITSIASASSANHAYAYDPARQLTQEDGTAFHYDAAGRLISSGATNATFPATVTTYGPGNQVGSETYPATNAVVSLDVVCVSPANVSDWMVKANGVEAGSSAYQGTCTTFAVANVPLGGNSAWAKVKLEGEEAVSKDTAGWSQWGKYQPETDHELHFTVEPATQPGEGVFPVAPNTNTAYTYDGAGQMVQRSGTGGSPVSYAYDSARNMRQCVFGANGERTNFYQYDHARRLVREDHTCTGIVEQSFTYVYDGMDVIAKVDNLSGEMVYFTRGLGIAPGVGDVLAETHILGSLTQTYIYVQNHRGDTIALVEGSNGTVVARYDYDAWGNPEPLNPEPSVTAFFTFSGKHYDADARLYYYGFRWYDPVAKRWTQPDPSGLKEGLDLYRFCGNDAINNCDIDGLTTCICLESGNISCDYNAASVAPYNIKNYLTAIVVYSETSGLKPALVIRNANELYD